MVPEVKQESRLIMKETVEDQSYILGMLMIKQLFQFEHYLREEKKYESV